MSLLPRLCCGNYVSRLSTPRRAFCKSSFRSLSSLSVSPPLLYAQRIITNTTITTTITAASPSRIPAPQPRLSLSAPVRAFSTTMSLTAQELSQYLADAPPSVVRLEIAKHFEALTDSQKRYAHYISR